MKKVNFMSNLTGVGTGALDGYTRITDSNFSAESLQSLLRADHKVEKAVQFTFSKGRADYGNAKIEDLRLLKEGDTDGTGAQFSGTIYQSETDESSLDVQVEITFINATVANFFAYTRIAPEVSGALSFTAKKRQKAGAV